MIGFAEIKTGVSLSITEYQGIVLLSLEAGPMKSVARLDECRINQSGDFQLVIVGTASVRIAKISIGAMKARQIFDAAKNFSQCGLWGGAA